MPAYRVNRVRLLCAYAPCSTPFDVLPSEAKRGMKYCSHRCSELASRHRRVEHTTLICAYEPCSKPFDVAPSRLKEARFCSRLCQTKAIRWPGPWSDRFWQKVVIGSPSECWLWQGSVLNSGYGQFQVHDDGRLLCATAHVASWFLSQGAWPSKGMQVLHNCPEGRDNPLCVNPAHLWLGTQSQNMQDSVQKGRNMHVTRPETLARGDRHGLRIHRDRAPRGERNVNSKMTDAQWQEAFALYATGQWTQTQLAKRYRVHQTSISSRLKHQY